MDRSRREGTMAIVGAVLLLAAVVVPAAGLGTTGAAVQEDSTNSVGTVEDAVDSVASSVLPPDAATEDGANFTLSHVAPPELAAPNSSIGLQATVTNEGNTTANQTVGYHFEGETLWSETVELESGESFYLVPTDPEEDEPDGQYAVADVTIDPAAVANATADGETVEEATYTHGVYTPQDVANGTVDLRTETTEVGGLVYDEHANEPIGDATVTLEADGEMASSALETETAENGSFTFESAPAPANYTLTFEHEAYVTTSVTTPTDEIEHEPVPVGWPIWDSFALEPFGTVNGTISDTNGSAVADANVTLADDAGNVIDSTSTDADGDYAFDDVASGTYNVSANATGYGEQSTDEVVVDPTETATANLTLPAEPSYVLTSTELPSTTVAGQNYTVSATVQNQGDQLGDRSLRYKLADDESVPGEDVAETDLRLDGGDNETVEFEIDGSEVAESGTYEQRFETWSDYENATLNVTANGSLEGEVRSNVTDDPLAEATVRLLDDGEEVDENTTNENGAYAFVDLDPGTYAVAAEAENYRENRTTVTVTSTGTSEADPLELAPEPGAIEVTVSDLGSGEHIEGADVEITTGDGVLSPTVDEGVTGADGTFTAENLTAERSYDVAVEADDYHANDTSVDLAPGATDDVEVVLSPDVSFEVLDRSAPGTAVEGENVTVSATFENPSTVEASENVTLVVATDEQSPVHQESFDLTIDSDSTEVVETTWNSTVGDAGSYIVGVSDDDEVDSFELIAAEGTVTGTVTGPDDGLADAEVTLRGTTGETVYTNDTDATGQFTFESVAIGEYDLQIDPETHEASNRTVTVHAGETHTENVSIQQLPGAVTGTVTFDGVPLEDASVSIDEEGSVETDTDGSYELRNVSTGEHTIEVNAEGYEPVHELVMVEPNATHVEDFSLSPEEMGISGVVSGSVTNDPIENATVTVRAEDDEIIATIDTSDAGDFSVPIDQPGDDYSVTVSAPDYESTAREDLEVSAGQTTTIDVELRPIPATIRGTAVSEVTGEPIEDGYLLLLGDGEEYQATTNDSGMFAFEGLDPGQYELIVDPENHDLERLEFTVGPNETVNESISLSPDPAPVHGIVQSVNGVSVANATIDFHTEGIGTATSDSDGTFSLEAVPAEVVHEYTVSAGDYVDETGNFSFEAGQGIDNHEISLRPLPASVTGNVTSAVSGVPIESATIDPDVDGVDTVQTDGDGTFEIDALPAEQDYTFSVRAEDYGNATWDVALGANESKRAAVELTPQAGTVEGHVTDDKDNETPVTDATVELDDVNATTTDENGTYVLEDVPADASYNLSITAPTYAPDETQFFLGPNESTTRNATLAPANVSVDSLDAPASVEEDDDVSVTANVTVRDGRENATVDFLVDGGLVENRTVEFEALNQTANETTNESASETATETVSFQYAPSDADTYTLAIRTADDRRATTLDVEESSAGGGGFPPLPPADDDDESEPPSTDPSDDSEPDISVLSADVATSTIDAGESVRVDATVQNLGDAAGTTELTLTVDGEAADTTTVDVPAGSNVGTTLSAEFEEPGSYDLAVDGHDAGTVDVLGEDGTTGEDDSAAADAPSGADDDGMPGFGFVVGVLAVVGALVLTVREHLV